MAFDSPDVDYQPAIIRVDHTGDLMMVFERLDPSTFLGDMYVAFSSDNGMTWTKPQVIIATSNDERSPALVQVGQNSFVLLYLSYSASQSDYRIHRATSIGGLSWTLHGQVDLGWTTKGEINPNVIREADGTLTMTYHRLHGPSYIAQSTNDGATWDKRKTQVSPSNAQLPRIAKRETDGLYLITYQTGSTPCHMWAKTSTDPLDWSGAAVAFDTVDNSHDSQPVVLEGGTFFVTYARATTNYFDICYRTSFDGKDWSGPTQLTTDPSRYDTQPHPIRHGEAGKVIVIWSHQDSASPYVDHDIWIEPELELALPLWLDKETISAGAGGTVAFTLDAGSGKANRTYLLLAGVSGTESGYLLPGGTTSLPLNWDFFTDIALSLVNTALFMDFMGQLDSQGTAAAKLDTLAPLPPMAVGAVLYFAYCLDYPWEFASNPLCVEITP
jgi:hypothetical protein